MTEPSVSGPTWDSTGTPWRGSDNLQEPIWRAQYDWHCGLPEKPSWDAGAAAQGDIDDLAAQLHSNVEMEAVRAAYTLGVSGGDAGRAELLAALGQLPAEEITVDELASKFDEADPTVQAAYGLVEQGAAAVPALLDLAGSDETVLRARAIDILGDIGPQAVEALPTLLAAVQDDPEEDPRRRAVEAIGTVGCGAPDQAELCLSLAASLDDASPQVRRNAAYSLARLAPALRDAPLEQSEVAVSALAKTLTDTTEFARGFSALALERMGTEGSFKAALAHLQTMRFD
jgi:HEAT repeat protein